MRYIPVQKRLHAGIRIRTLDRSSLLYAAGLRANDIILEVNGETIGDELDFQFAAAHDILEIEYLRGSGRRFVQLIREQGQFLSVDFHEKSINRCTNRCIFCFIDQMPRGLRRGLYTKDEDFKHSFLNGNYVTLSGASDTDLAKVARIGLSPLFISVHATERTIRNDLLGNKRAPDILGQLRFLKKNGISFHTQIVVCPGHNDGQILHKTIQDLFSFGSALLSIAVVPVGLTRHRAKPLEGVDSTCARKVCSLVDEISDHHCRLDGVRKLFSADEFYGKAALPIPPRSYYQDYPQIGNGVGLVRQLLDEWKRLKRKMPVLPRTPFHQARIAIVTSQSAQAYIEAVARELETRIPLDGAVLAVPNRFFGESVTVAGLLTARDVLAALADLQRNSPCTLAVVPSVMFNFAGYTLDGWSITRMNRHSPVSLKIARDIAALIECCESEGARSQEPGVRSKNTTKRFGH